MIKGILVVDQAGLPRYSYVDPTIDPVVFAGFINAIQTVIGHLLKQKIKKIETGETQLIAESSGDVDVVLLADKEDDPDLLVKYLSRVVHWLQTSVNVSGGETQLYVTKQNEMELLTIMEAYRTEYIRKKLNFVLQSKELLGWLDDKKLGALIETIILRGRVEISGAENLKEVVKYFTNILTPSYGIVETGISEYFFTLEYDSKKIDTNAPNLIGPMIAKFLRNNELDTVAEYISNIRRVANRIFLIHKKGYSPREIIEDLSKNIGDVKFKDEMYKFSAILAGILFKIDNTTVKKILSDISVGLFMNSF